MIALPPNSEPPQPTGGAQPLLTMENWERIAELIRARQPLEAGLQAVAQELPFGRQRRQLLRLAAELERGKSPEELGNSPRIPDDLRELFRAGVETGQLGPLLQDYIDDALQAQDLRWQVRFFTFYSLALITVALVVNAFIVSLIANVSARIVKDFDMQTIAPVFSPSLVTIVAWTAAFLPFALAAFAGLISRLLPVRFWAIFYQLPVLGGLFRWPPFARGSRILACLLQVQCPLPKCFGIAGRAVRHPLASHAFLKMQSKIEDGTPLADAALAVSTLPSSLREVFAQLQDSPALPELLRGLADLYTQRSRELIRWFLAFWEPAVLFGCGAMVLFFYTGISVHLFQLLRGLM